MKSRLSLKNLIKRALLLNSSILALLLLGCSLSTDPTYIKEEISKAIQDLCNNEYKLEIHSKLVGQTLWVYLPVEELLQKSDKPEKYTEKFSIEINKAAFIDKNFKIEYLIKKIADQQKSQEYKFNKAVLEKSNNVWKTIRRVLFSMERGKEAYAPKFLCLVTADIKSGLVMKDLVYIIDLKKVSYEFISWTEYQHRSIQEVGFSPIAIGDQEGKNIDYKDVLFADFLALQMQQRIKLKYQKPEVGRDTNIDQEILKVVVHTIKTYQFKDFNEVELANSFAGKENKMILNKEAVWARSIEK